MTCPSGHPTIAADYCDTCGLPIGAPPAPVAAPVAAPAPATQACPNCAEPNVPDAVFCESCGHDHTTATDWVVELRIDPDWHALQRSDDPCPPAGDPVVVPVTAKSVLVGRPSKSRGITPEIDCGDDTGVSRRQAQLTTDGRRWWVEDLQSSNGTFVGQASAPLPEDPIPAGRRHELDDDDRLYVGAWTRLVIRPATSQEQADQL